jgi:hypothetical protein
MELKGRKRAGNWCMPTNPKAGRNLRCPPTPAPRVTAVVSLAATLILTASAVARATTINAKSASQSDVAAAIASAADGDTVTLPSGTFTWTSGVTITKAITLQGAGIGNTIIIDANNNSGEAAIDIYFPSLVANKLTRLTGIEIRDGGRINTGIGGVIKAVGSNTNGSRFRMDHCKMNNVKGMTVMDTVIGVIDHNTFLCSTDHELAVVPYANHWNGPDGHYGDGSWSDATNFGSDRFLFIEDNVFDQEGPAPRVPGATDGYSGARFVVRYNQIHDCTIETHGTESNARNRGTRAVEVYNNTFSGTNRNRFLGGMRSGIGLWHDNNISGYLTGSMVIVLEAYRALFNFDPWGGADGTNPWDLNSGPYYSGSAASGGSLSVTVSGNPWVTNQWVDGYVIRKDAGGSKNGGYAPIESSTTNTIVFKSNPFGASLNFAPGDTFKIYKIERALDQPGVAKGSLLPNIWSLTPPRTWNDQVVEACYSWNNVSQPGNVPVNFVANEHFIREGEHFKNNTPMPGYTPYIYPHPLVNGGALPLLPSPAATRTSQPKPWGKKQEKTKELKRKSAKKAKQNPANEKAESQEKLGN